MNETKPKKCPVCGETDPYPAWFCLPRQVGIAEKDKPCSYSKEGHDRMVAKHVPLGNGIKHSSA